MVEILGGMFSDHQKPKVSYMRFAAAGISLSNPILHKSARF
jgi:hypothetical protein